MMTLIKTFLRAETGAAKTQAGFAVAASIGVMIVSAYLVFHGGAAPQRFEGGPPPEEVALATLLNGQIQQFNPLQTETRLRRYINPAERTDAQLRNAHRIWARRAADRWYENPELASDMFLIIDAAMQLRGVRPHSDI